MSKKLIFAQNALSVLTNLAGSLDRAENVLMTWYARGYGAGSSNEIMDSDVQQLGIKASDLQNIMFLIDSLTKYLKGQDAPKADFMPTLLKLREDI
jgi:hypothetical protein